jgi:hypothetical protein
MRARFGFRESRTAVATPMHGGAASRRCRGVAVVTGMWWWASDFGQVFGGFDRKEVEARLSTSMPRRRGCAPRPRTCGRNSRSKRPRDEPRREQGLSRQSNDLVTENAQLKEEVRSCKSSWRTRASRRDSRFRASPSMSTGWRLRYNLIVVRGRQPEGDFEARGVQAALSAPTAR